MTERLAYNPAADEPDSAPIDTAPLMDDAETAAFDNGVFRDFYQSFRLAQGEAEGVQLPLFDMLRDQHHLAGHGVDELAASLQRNDERVDRLALPARHATLEEVEEAESEGFRATWTRYHQVLTAGATPQVDGVAHYDVLSGIVRSDKVYVIDPVGRPGRDAGGDPHESVLREYIMGDSLTGSVELMAVRDQLRDAIGRLDTETSAKGIVLAERLHELEGAWEDRHPGEPFFATPVAPTPGLSADYADNTSQIVDK